MGVYRGLKTTTGPSSYSSGGFTVTIGNIEKIEKALAYASGGYIAGVTGIVNNVATVAVYTAAGSEVAAGTDLSNVTIVIAYEGY